MKTTTELAVVDPERLGLPSASSAQRRYACPGSWNAEKDLPEPNGSDIADEGTLIHRALETGDPCELSDEQVAIYEKLQQLAERALVEWSATLPEGSNVQTVKERRLWFRDAAGQKIQSAKLDLLCIAGDRAFIADFKSGFLDADPSSSNYQLRVQALCVRQNYPEVKHIRVAIVQHRFKSNLNAADYSEAELDYSERELLFVTWRMSLPDAPRSAGKQCRYCKAASTCMEYSVYSQMPATRAALGIDMAKKDIVARVQEMTVPDLVYVESRRTAAINLFEAVKDRLKSLPAEELQAHGLMLGKGSKVAKIANIKRALEIIVGQNKWLTPDEFDALLTIAIGKVEEIAIKRLASREGVSQKAAKEQFRQELAGTIEYTEKAGSLVPFKPEIAD